VLVGDEAATAVVVPANQRLEFPNADHPWVLVNDDFESVPTCINVDLFGLATDCKIKHQFQLQTSSFFWGQYY
jgi:hypothetical protein